mmetsp:Transcript_22571/g.70273  ORF Transcript_22571/g.70273 Transcript_22571/m.70273 type:complete len:222 (-) Transcript_22571:469-1134(-)
MASGRASRQLGRRNRRGAPRARARRARAAAARSPAHSARRRWPPPHPRTSSPPPDSRAGNCRCCSHPWEAAPAPRARARIAHAATALVPAGPAAAPTGAPAAPAPPPPPPPRSRPQNFHRCCPQGRGALAPRPRALRLRCNVPLGASTPPAVRLRAPRRRASCQQWARRGPQPWRRAGGPRQRRRIAPPTAGPPGCRRCSGPATVVAAWAAAPAAPRARGC